MANGEERFEIGITIENQRRQGFVNGQPLRSLTEYVGRLIFVSFCPDDLALVKGAPAERRSFVDKHLVDFDPKIFQTLSAYQRLSRRKNALLADGRASPLQVETLNALIAEPASEIFLARHRFIAEVMHRARLIHGAFSAKMLGAVYRPALGQKNEQRDEFSEIHDSDLSPSAVQEALQSGAAREMATRSATVGPHRDEIRVTLDRQEARQFASQGEARSAVLAMKLAVIELLEEKRATSPVVLLDDVDSELDSERRSALFKVFTRNKRQTFITTTDRSSLGEAAAQRVFEVREGKIETR